MCARIPSYQRLREIVRWQLRTHALVDSSPAALATGLPALRRSWDPWHAARRAHSTDQHGYHVLDRFDARQRDRDRRTGASRDPQHREEDGGVNAAPWQHGGGSGPPGGDARQGAIDPQLLTSSHRAKAYRAVILDLLETTRERSSVMIATALFQAARYFMRPPPEVMRNAATVFLRRMPTALPATTGRFLHACGLIQYQLSEQALNAVLEHATAPGLLERMEGRHVNQHLVALGLLATAPEGEEENEEFVSSRLPVREDLLDRLLARAQDLLRSPADLGPVLQSLSRLGVPAPELFVSFALDTFTENLPGFAHERGRSNAAALLCQVLDSLPALSYEPRDSVKDRLSSLVDSCLGVERIARGSASSNRDPTSLRLALVCALAHAAPAAGVALSDAAVERIEQRVEEALRDADEANASRPNNSRKSKGLGYPLALAVSGLAHTTRLRGREREMTAANAKDSFLTNVAKRMRQDIWGVQAYWVMEAYVAFSHLGQGLTIAASNAFTHKIETDLARHFQGHVIHNMHRIRAAQIADFLHAVARMRRKPSDELLLLLDMRLRQVLQLYGVTDEERESVRSAFAALGAESRLDDPLPLPRVSEILGAPVTPSDSNTLHGTDPVTTGIHRKTLTGPGSYPSGAGGRRRVELSPNEPLSRALGQPGEALAVRRDRRKGR